MRSPLVGTSYTARSPNLAHNRCVNLYLESAETKEGSAPNALMQCPGIVASGVTGLGAGPWRAIKVVSGVIYAVVGNVAYRIVGTTATTLGSLATSTGYAQILSNPTQIAFFDTQSAYVWTLSSSAYQVVPYPFSGFSGSATYLDGFALINQIGTFNIWQSNLNDFTSWDALNFTTEDGNAQSVVALAALHDQIIVLKEYSICFYANAGLNGFVFQRIDGVYPSIGCVTPLSVVVLDDVLFWLGQTSQTLGKVYLLSGYEPQEVSTYAIENTIQGYGYSDAYAFGYGQGGHPFYVISFPSGGQTFVFDLKETKALKAMVWHERASFAAGKFGIYAGGCAAQLGDVVYMGDAANSNLYTLNLNIYTDNGATRRWLRSWRSVAEAQYATEKVNYLDIQMDTGYQVPVGTNPQLVLKQSLDGGFSWSAEFFQPIGQTGDYQNDVKFTRLGSTRRGLNSYRLFELSSTDVFGGGLLGADIG